MNKRKNHLLTMFVCLLCCMLFGVCFTVYAADATPKVNYEICAINSGWNGLCQDREKAQLTDGRYATAFRAHLYDLNANEQVGIRYKINLSGMGWLHEAADGRATGFSGGVQPIEAISLSLYGADAGKYELYYKVCQNDSWTDWVKNGAVAGTEGQGLQLQGIQLTVLPAGAEPPGREVDPNKPMVAITYDDGPDPKVTPRILDALEAVDGRATFFMVGTNVTRPENADIIRRMAEMGCDLGNHTYRHGDLKKMSASDAKQTIRQVSDALTGICGQGTTLMRPTYGNYNASVKQSMAEIGHALIMWNIDTLDWKTKNADNTVQEILNNVKDGDIILMHDLYEQTAVATERVVPELVKRGFQLVTIHEMAEARGIEIQPGDVYSRIRPQSEWGH